MELRSELRHHKRLARPSGFAVELGHNVCHHGPELLDRKRVVRPRESLEWTRRLLSDGGIFAGISSGAALAGAVKVAQEIDEGVIVFIVCDGGWKYLSTGAYTDDLDEAEARAEQIIYF